MTEVDYRMLISIIHERQGLPWGYAKLIEWKDDFLKKVFSDMNNGVISLQPWFYRGDLYRIHTPHSGLAENIDENIERIVSEICDDGSCSILPYTQYTTSLVAFTKLHDFTDNAFNKVYDQMSTCIQVNTGELYGIDVNALYDFLGIEKFPPYEQEQEVMFPLLKEYVIQEHVCTPLEFKAYIESNNNE
jgi:hypothetical protein